MQKIKVLVVDHMPLFREALCRYLTNGIDLEVVADTESVEETVKLIMSCFTGSLTASIATATGHAL